MDANNFFIVRDNYLDALKHERKLINRIFSIANSFWLMALGSEGVALSHKSTETINT